MKVLLHTKEDVCGYIGVLDASTNDNGGKEPAVHPKCNVTVNTRCNRILVWELLVGVVNHSTHPPTNPHNLCVSQRQRCGRIMNGLRRNTYMNVGGGRFLMVW